MHRNVDYDKLKKIGGFRGVCKSICEKLRKNECLYPDKDAIAFDEYEAAACSNDCCSIHSNDEYSFLEEKNSSNSNLFIQDRTPNNSTTDNEISSEPEFDSDYEINTQLFYRPSILHRQTAQVERFALCSPSGAGSENTNLYDDNNNNGTHSPSFYNLEQCEFSQQRLNNLVRTTTKIELHPDNYLPGDQTTLYALRYHNVDE